MCTGAEIALLAGSAAASVGGSVMSNRAQSKQMDAYNRQVEDQNKLIQTQYQDRQNTMARARDSQAKLFDEVGAKQDAELARQRSLGDEKKALFQNAVETQPMAKGSTLDSAVAERKALFDMEPNADGTYQVPTSGGGTEDRVLRQAGEKASGVAAAKAGKQNNALVRLGAMGDVQSGQTRFFNDVGRSMDDKAKDAAASESLLGYNLRPDEARMNSLGNVMGEQVQLPYYRGVEPVFNPANTLGSDLLSGAGTLALAYGSKNLGSSARKKPKTAESGGLF